MKWTHNNLPMIVCPHCGEEYQHDDYYDIQSDDTLDCPSCEKEIHVLEVDTIIYARVGTEGAK